MLNFLKKQKVKDAKVKNITPSKYKLPKSVSSALAKASKQAQKSSSLASVSKRFNKTASLKKKLSSFS